MCVRTVGLGHDHSEVSDGSVGVTEPGAVEAEQDGGRRDLGRPLADMYAGGRDRRAWKEADSLDRLSIKFNSMKFNFFFYVILFGEFI